MALNYLGRSPLEIGFRSNGICTFPVFLSLNKYEIVLVECKGKLIFEFATSFLSWDAATCAIYCTARQAGDHVINNHCT